MKILHINATRDCGSTGNIIQNISKCCEIRGLHSFVAYAFTKDSPMPDDYKIGNLLSRKTHALLSRISGKQAYYSTCSTIRLLCYISKTKPDVVHLHNLHSNYINLNLLFRYLSANEIRIVITLHDCWFFTGGCTHYSNLKCFRWKENCGHCPQRYNETPAYICDGSSKILNDRKHIFKGLRNLTVIGVSNWISSEASKGVFKGARVFTIHNGVDIDVFKPVYPNFRINHGLKDKFVILGPASKWLAPDNGYLLEDFISKMTDDEVFIIMGCHPNRKSNSEKILFISYIDNQNELVDLYSSADVFVNCTHEESLSMVNVEAQACGTPVVSFDGTGVQETVDNVCSFSVEQNNIDAMRQVITMIKNNGKGFYSNKCTEWVSSFFNMKKNFNEYVDMYEGKS